MTIMIDKEIHARCPNPLGGMIDPFVGHQEIWHGAEKVISYGLSSCGYDVRLGYGFMVPVTPSQERLEGRKPPTVIDPKHLDENLFEHIRCNDDSGFLMKPHGFCLGTTIETFHMPNDMVGICTGKSTYARCGILVTPTPLEPGWRGELTVEITNVTDYPAIIYPGEGICQIVFHLLDKDPAVTYADRKGKYQDQKGVTPAKV